MKVLDELDAPQPHSIWLCPSEPQAGALCSEVEGLSQQYDTPVFEPHMTLLGDLQVAPSSTVAALHNLRPAIPVFDAVVQELSTTPAFFMSLFLDLNVPATVEAVRRQLAVELTGARPGLFRPHVSLAYGVTQDAVPTRAKETLTEKYVGQDFRFDRLVIVSSAQSIPIERWRPLMTLPLSV